MSQNQKNNDFSASIPTNLGELEQFVAVNSENADARFALGKLYWKHGNIPAAITQYKETLRLNPEHGAAATALELATGVQNYFNPDMLNP